MITYKFYSTKKTIPWLIGGGENNFHPQPSIQDGFFAFQELKPPLQFNFINTLTTTIVADDNDWTYWKIEKIKNGVVVQNIYFYTNKVLKIIKNAYELELKLDLYMTYTKNLIKDLGSSTEPFKLKRGTITNQSINDAYDSHVLKRALSNIDEEVLNFNNTYKEVIPFPLVDIAESNLFPITSYKQTYYGFGLSPLHWYSGLAPRPTQTDNDKAYQLTDVFNENGTDILNLKIKTKINFNDIHTDRRLEPFTTEDAVKLENARKLLAKSYKMIGINEDDNKTLNFEDVNNGAMQGYFAVFRNNQGFIDAYPLIGKVNVRMQIPISDSNRNTNTGNQPGRVRFYIPSKSYQVFTMHNDLDSITTEYINNKNGGYTGDNHFAGIFKWTLLGGEKCRLSYVLKENNTGANNWEPAWQQVTYTWNGQSKTGYCNIPHRFFYRFKLSELVELNLADSALNNSRIDVNSFYLTKQTDTNLLTNYINLLQPIMIGNQEFIPAKYAFLANIEITNPVNIGYTIPLSFGFSSGFKMFCRIGRYASNDLGLSFGGTLPASNGNYFKRMEELEIQKNAGIMNRGWNFLQGITGAIAKRDVVGGINTLVTSSLSAQQAENQYRFIRKNIGLTELSSTDEDLFNSLINNTFIVDSSDKYKLPLKLGLYSYGFKLVFDDLTMKKHINFYETWGFPINGFVGKQYFIHLYNYLNDANKPLNQIFFQFDGEWLINNFNPLTSINDMQIKNLVIQQLTDGIRLRRYA